MANLIALGGIIMNVFVPGVPVIVYTVVRRAGRISTTREHTGGEKPFDALFPDRSPAELRR